MSHRIALADEGGLFSFPCTESQSILDAATLAGIDLPHSCRQGICGNCAGEIVDGRILGLDGEAVASEMCRPGEVLFCRSVPASDLLIRPRSWQRADRAGQKRVKLKVYRNTRVASDVSILQLRLPAGQRVRFRAGQYLKMVVDESHARHYSMANPPHESDSVTLHVRHLPGGLFSSRLPSLATGDILEAELPFGQFCVPEDERRSLVFVATGTGFAPVKSILDDLLKRGLRTKTTLIWGARATEGLYMMSAARAWQARSPDFRFIPAISGSLDPSVEGIFAGRVDAALQANFPSLHGHALYCCGSPEMTRSVFGKAVELGLALADFHADAFVAAGEHST